MKKDYYLYSEAKSRNGYVIDELISNLQKSIRRQDEYRACQTAYELYITSPVLLEKLWKRLLVISVEDIGFGDLNASGQINTLNQMRQEFSYDDPDQPMFFIHAIRILCAASKDRSSDYLKNLIIKRASMGEKVEIMDLALDKHTKRGQEMGRDSLHFFNEACLVFPQIPVDNNYREQYGELLENYDREKYQGNMFDFGINRD